MASPRQGALFPEPLPIREWGSDGHRPLFWGGIQPDQLALTHPAWPLHPAQLGSSALSQWGTVGEMFVI